MFPICCRWCLHSHTLSITNQYHSIPFDTIHFNSFHLPLYHFYTEVINTTDCLSVGLSIRLSTRQTIFGWMLASMWLNWRISLEYYTIVVVIGVGGYVVFMSIQPYENYYLCLVFIRLFLDWLTGGMAIDYRFLHIED